MKNQQETQASNVRHVPTKHKNPQYLKRVAERFVKQRIAQSRGWTNVDIFDVHEGTNDWFASHPARLARERGCEKSDLCKWDFDIGFGVEDSKSLGVALDRRTGEVIEVYVGREGASSPDDH